LIVTPLDIASSIVNHTSWSNYHKVIVVSADVVVRTVDGIQIPFVFNESVIEGC